MKKTQDGNETSTRKEQQFFYSQKMLPIKLRQQTNLVALSFIMLATF